MSKYTYECEDCHQQIVFNEPKKAPFYIPHACIEDTYIEGVPASLSVLDCGGACYRVWEATPVYVKGKK